MLLKGTVGIIPKRVFAMDKMSILFSAGICKQSNDSVDQSCCNIEERRREIAAYAWDLVFEPHGRKSHFCHELVKRNYHGARDGDVQVSSAEFDSLIGDKQAVIDSLSMLFAPELLAAYPGAKVVLNGRRDVSQIVRVSP
ncbi:hypothetical protein ABHI18_010603 [Aspergillus niger]